MVNVLLQAQSTHDDDSVCTNLNEAPKMIDEYGNEQKTGRNGFASYLATWQVPTEMMIGPSKKNKVKLVKNVLPEHNCEFIAYDETLIDSIKLSQHGC